MKLDLFRELVDLNRAFEEVIRGLARMEKVRHFQRDLIRYARADVETARVDANREFFDNFEALVEDDASWAYKFQRQYKQKAEDPDVYFEIKDSEERRKKKGLPPRVVILPDWDFNDEGRYDDEQVAKKKRAARKKAGAINRRRVSPAKGKKRAQAVVAAASEGEGKQ
jgi:hypothetical protein